MSHVVDSIVFVALGVASSLKCFVLYLQREIKLTLYSKSLNISNNLEAKKKHLPHSIEAHLN